MTALDLVARIVIRLMPGWLYERIARDVLAITKTVMEERNA